jgi:hypothetical protein
LRKEPIESVGGKDTEKGRSRKGAEGRRSRKKREKKGATEFLTHGPSV